MNNHQENLIKPRRPSLSNNKYRTSWSRKTAIFWIKKKSQTIIILQVKKELHVNENKIQDAKTYIHSQCSQKYVFLTMLNVYQVGFHVSIFMFHLLYTGQKQD